MSDRKILNFSHCVLCTHVFKKFVSHLFCHINERKLFELLCLLWLIEECHTCSPKNIEKLGLNLPQFPQICTKMLRAYCPKNPSLFWNYVNLILPKKSLQTFWFLKNQGTLSYYYHKISACLKICLKMKSNPFNKKATIILKLNWSSEILLILGLILKFSKFYPITPQKIIPINPHHYAPETFKMWS